MEQVLIVKPDHDRPTEERHPLARPATLKRLRWAGIAALAALLVAGLFVHGHPHFALDAVTGFYAGFGLLAGLAAVAVGKVWSILLRRKDGYYD